MARLAVSVMESENPMIQLYYFILPLDAGVVTDSPVKVQLSHKECQTSKEDITDR